MCHPDWVVVYKQVFLTECFYEEVVLFLFFEVVLTGMFKKGSRMRTATLAPHRRWAIDRAVTVCQQRQDGLEPTGNHVRVLRARPQRRRQEPGAAQAQA